jgi:hypothetical protein
MLTRRNYTHLERPPHSSLKGALVNILLLSQSSQEHVAHIRPCTNTMSGYKNR